jgi:polar amino acid transport system substrate-binding protein
MVEASLVRPLELPAMRVLRWMSGMTALLAVCGCAGEAATPTGSGSAVPAGAAVPAGLARDRLPADIRRGGVLVVGSDQTFPPMESVENGKPVGFDVDLVTGIAARLGLRLELRQVSFGELIDQVESGALMLSTSSMYDNAKRQQRVDFVDYFNVGTSVVVRKDAADVAGYRGLCGLRVAVQPATVYVELLAGVAATCPSGRRLSVVATSADRPALVAAGRVDAYLDDYPIAAYAVSKNGALRISGDQIEAQPYGIGVAKKRRDLAKAVQTALYELIDDGTYDRLVAKWKLPNGALKTGAINGGA